MKFFLFGLVLPFSFGLVLLNSCVHKPKLISTLKTDTQEKYNPNDFFPETADYVKNWESRKLAASVLSQYKITGDCGGFPRVNVKTAPGFCLGQLDDGNGTVFPRTAVEISPGKILVVDMGGWANSNGKLYLLTLTNGKYIRTTIMDAAKSADPKIKIMLDRPHLILKGPDGLFYLSSVSQIVRFNPNTANFLNSAEVIIKNIPNAGLHPLKAFTFDNQGNLFINVGTATNVCQKMGIAFAKKSYCLEVEDNDIGQGQVRKYTRLADGSYDKNFQVYARGLRNSMGLWWHKDKNILLQAENGRDAISDLNKSLSGRNLPHEEFNVVKEGGHYGWPYCYDNGLANPEWSYLNCDKYSKPYLLLPAHSAPLSILIYKGTLFPAWYQNRMLISLHGYEPLGHRIVAYRRDDNGLPVKEPMSVVYGWNADGPQSMGSPVGLSQMSDGSVLIVEDKSRKVLRLFYDPQNGDGTPVVEIPDKVGDDAAADDKEKQLKNKLAEVLQLSNPPLFAQIQNKMIDTSCYGCHSGADARGLELSRYDYIGNEARILSEKKGRQILYHLYGANLYKLDLPIDFQNGFLPMPPDGFKDKKETQDLISLYLAWLKLQGL